MATYVYAFGPKEEKRLELSWEGFDHNKKPIHILLDGDEIGVIPDGRALREGQVFQLSDSSAIHVQRIRRKGLQVFHSGKPLRILSPSEQVRIDTQAYKLAILTVCFIGWCTLLLGFFVLVLGAFSKMGFFVLYWMITGVAFLALGYLVKQAYVIALSIALVYYTMDTLSLVLLVMQGQNLAIIGIALHLCLMIPLHKGIMALSRLVQKEA